MATQDESLRRVRDVKNTYGNFHELIEIEDRLIYILTARPRFLSFMEHLVVCVIISIFLNIKGSVLRTGAPG